MNRISKRGRGMSPPQRQTRPIPRLSPELPIPEEKTKEHDNPAELPSKHQEAHLEDDQKVDNSDILQSEIARFVEISKYFSSPVNRSASYICENRLVSYPNPYRIEFKRGCVTTQHFKFSNLTLEPVYVKLYKLIPDLEQFKFINLAMSRCKRIPPGLSFNLGFVYDDVNEKPAANAKIIFVASRKSTTPCYQVCEIEMQIVAQKQRLTPT